MAGMDNAGFDEGGEVPLELAKRMIVSALGAFDPQLGKLAEDVLYDARRLNIVEGGDVGPSGFSMMQCRPSGLTKDDLEADGRLWDQDAFEREFPGFTEQENLHGPAVVDFRYAHSKNCVLYLAHETGHAIADDLQRERGRGFRDFSAHQQEQQAYFIQSVVAHAVDPGFNRESASYAAASALRLANEFNRDSQRYDAYTDFEKAQALPAASRSVYIQQLLGGESGQDGDSTCSVLRRSPGDHACKR